MASGKRPEKRESQPLDLSDRASHDFRDNWDMTAHIKWQSVAEAFPSGTKSQISRDNLSM